MPDEDRLIADAGAVLHVPGSKGARLTELSKAMAYAKSGLPCLVPDIVGSEAKSSTVDNQLKERMLSNAITVQIAHRLLSKMPGVNSEKIVWHGESIGNT